MNWAHKEVELGWIGLIENVSQNGYQHFLRTSFYFWVVITNRLLIYSISLIIIWFCCVGTEGPVKYQPSCVPQARWVSLHGPSLI